MKTIKFRGVRKDGKGFCYGDLIQTPDSDQRIIWFDERATFNEMIVFDSHSLFTGFTDKDGKEIYAGDIIGDWTEKLIKVIFKVDIQSILMMKKECSDWILHCIRIEHHHLCSIES